MSTLSNILTKLVADTQEAAKDYWLNEIDYEEYIARATDKIAEAMEELSESEKQLMREAMVL